MRGNVNIASWVAKWSFRIRKSKLIAAIFIWGSIQVACTNDAALLTIASPVSYIGTQTVWNNRSVQVVLADGKNRMITIVLDKDGSRKAKDRYSVSVNGKPVDSESQSVEVLRRALREEISKAADNDWRKPKMELVLEFLGPERPVADSKIGDFLKDQPYEELFRKIKALEKKQLQDKMKDVRKPIGEAIIIARISGSK